MNRTRLSKVKFTVFSIFVLAIITGVVVFFVLYLGVYNIAAVSPHYPFEIKLITFVKERSVKMRASHISLPSLNDAQLIQKGFNLYQDQCLLCHGAPNRSASKVFRGLNPTPPPLVKSSEHWSNEEIAWIIKNGFKMTGMPGFSLSNSSENIHALTAFVVRLNTLSPEEYKNMQKSSKGKLTGHQVQWVSPSQGWASLAKRGTPLKGKELIKEYGCLGCHKIDNIKGVQGNVGPSLNNWWKRHYISEKL